MTTKNSQLLNRGKAADSSGTRMPEDSVIKERSLTAASEEPDPLRSLRLIGATAALLAVIGIAILVFWFVLRFPRF